MTDNPANPKPNLFVLQQNECLGQASPVDDLLHPHSFSGITDDSATETQYFGFNIPDKHIQGYAYMWHHPSLKLCTGGLIVYQGIKPTTLHAELCDYRTFMSDAALANDLTEFRFDNGYGVKTLEPLKRYHMTYNDPARNNTVDIVFDGLHPPVMFGDGRHLEQAMRVTGSLTLRGKTHKVNSYALRDRSWGAPRPESLLEVPPLSWISVVFNEDFAFNCCVFDQASRNPGRYAMADDKALSGGWVQRDGKLGRIVTARKRAWRNPGTTLCPGIELQITDDLGRLFDMRGTLVASTPLTLWNNSWAMINLMRWECGDVVGYGDNQEAFWNDYLNTPA